MIIHDILKLHTQAELARLCDVSRATVCMWASGKRSPSQSTEFILKEMVKLRMINHAINVGLIIHKRVVTTCGNVTVESDGTK